VHLDEAAVRGGAKYIAQLVEAFGAEAREEGVERRADAEVRDLTEEFGTVVLFLDRVGLSWIDW
jgi:hypothetical protein